MELWKVTVVVSIVVTAVVYVFQKAGFKSEIQLPKPSDEKHLVVLGGGSASWSFLTSFENQKDWKLTVVSATEASSFKPLISEVVGGNLLPEHTDVQWAETLKSLSFVSKKFIKDKAVDVDFETKTVQLEKNKEISYDYLVVATGAKFIDKVPGAEKAKFLGNGSQALEIRKGIKSLTTKGLGKINLVFVGGGPTAVEGCVNAFELLRDKEKAWNIKGNWTCHIATSSDRLLSGYHIDASKKAEERFAKLGIKMHLKRRLKSVETKYVVITDENGNEEKLNSDFTVLGIGLEPNELTLLLSSKNSVYKDDRYIPTNSLLQIAGRKTEFAIGDCKVMHVNPLTDAIDDIFKKANPPSNFWLKTNSEVLSTSFPQLQTYQKVPNIDWNSKQVLTKEDFQKILRKLDVNYVAPGKTAAVAFQEGIYLAKNFHAIISSKDANIPSSFVYHFKGRLCYVGDGAVMEKPDGTVSNIPGKMWRGVYLTLAPKKSATFQSWTKTMFGRYD